MYGVPFVILCENYYKFCGETVLNVLQAKYSYDKMIYSMLYDTASQDKEAFCAGQAKTESLAEEAGHFRYYYDTGR